MLFQLERLMSTLLLFYLLHSFIWNISRIAGE